MKQESKKSSARDVFFYLLMIVTLYIGVVGFLTIIFQLVNSWFPDPFDYYRSINTSLRFGISSVIIVCPLFLFMSWVIERDLKKDFAKNKLKIRRWLLYLTLFIAAITMIVDLITLVNEFLGGELTIRFFLKTIAVLIVAAAVFGYYLWALKNDTTKSKIPNVMLWVTGVVTLVLVVVALVTAGSPAKQRALRFDEERLGHLQTIQNQVVEHWRNKGQLPQSFAAISTGLGQFEEFKDSETGESYQYKVLGDLTFELCANFNLASSELVGPDRPRVPYSKTQTSWEHGVGLSCFETTIDPDFFEDNERAAEKPVPARVPGDFN